MDLTKLLTNGQRVQVNDIVAVVDLTTVETMERRYRLRFEDGSTKWVNQALARQLLQKN